MKATIAIYYNPNPSDEEFFDIAAISKKYSVKLTLTPYHDWGGESVFEISGTKKALDFFATDFCACEKSISELEPTSLY